MKKLLILPSILVVLLGVALIAPSFIDWSQYRSQIETQAEKATGYDVVLAGDIGLSIIPYPRVSVEQVTVNAPEGLKSDYLVKLERLDLGLALFPLLAGQIEIAGLDLVGADIVLQVGADGTPRGLPQPADGAEPQESQAAKDIKIGNVSIANGKLRLINDATAAEYLFTDINMDLSADSLQGPLDVAGGFQTQGLNIALDAAIDRLSRGQAVPVNLKANINQNASLTYAGVIESGESFALQGEVLLDVENPQDFGVAYGQDVQLKTLLTADAQRVTLDQIQINSGANQAQGKIDIALEPLSVSGDIRSLQNDLGQRVIVEFQAAQNGANIQITDSTLALGASTAKLTATYNTSKPGLDLQARLDRFDAAQFQDVAGAASPQSPGGSSSASIQNATSSLTIPMDISADITIDQGNAGGFDFAGLRMNGSVNKDGLLKISRASVQDLAGAQIVLQGEVTDIAALSGIDGSVSLSTRNIRDFARTFGVNVAFLPDDIQGMNLAAKAKGDLNAMDLTLNARAMSGEIIAQGVFQNPLAGLVTDQLALQVKHPNLGAAIKLLNPAFVPPGENFATPLDFYSDVALGENNYSLSNIQAQIFGSTLNGNLDVSMAGSVPRLNGALQFGALDLGRVAAPQAATQRSSAGGAVSSTAQRWSIDPVDTGFLDLANFDLELNAASLKYAGWDLTAPAFKATLENGVLNIADISAGLYGGQLSSAALIQKQQKGLSISASPSIQNVSLTPLVESLARGNLISGQGLINLDAAIETSGASQSALVRGLAGQGTVSGSNLAIDGLDLSQFARALSDESKPGDTLLGLWQGASSGGSTAFDSLDGNFTIQQGVINLTKLDLTGAQADIATTGTISLPQWRLTTQHNVTVKGGSELPSFTMEFEGPLDNPAQTFGQGALENYLQRKLERKIQKELGGRLGDVIGDQLGVPGLFRSRSNDSSTTQQQPANDNVIQSTPAENNATQRVEPQSLEEEVIRGVLDGLFSR